MIPGLAGFLCLGAFLLSGLWMEQVRERPVYDRPGILVHPTFWKIWRAARAILFVAGWILAGGAWPLFTALFALLLLGLWGWKRLLRSRRHRHRMIRRAFERERARDTASSDVQILQRILHSLHAKWGEELIEQIVLDNPTPEGVAEMVLRMERGALPSGFHPGRLQRGGG